MPLNDAILLDAVFKMRGEVLPLITAQFHGEALAFEQLVEHRFFLAQFFQRLGKGRTVNCCGNAPFGDIHGDRLLRQSLDYGRRALRTDILCLHAKHISTGDQPESRKDAKQNDSEA